MRETYLHSQKTTSIYKAKVPLFTKKIYYHLQRENSSTSKCTFSHKEKVPSITRGKYIHSQKYLHLQGNVPPLTRDKYLHLQKFLLLWGKSMTTSTHQKNPPFTRKEYSYKEKISPYKGESTSFYKRKIVPLAKENDFHLQEKNHLSLQARVPHKGRVSSPFTRKSTSTYKRKV